MAGWQEAVKPHVDSGRLSVLGVVQEQHPDRARLYRQWKEISWPIAIDALNTLGLKVVPVPLGVDESGVVRVQGATKDGIAAFVAAAPVPAGTGPATAREWSPGEAHFHAGRWDEAVTAFEEAVRAAPGDAAARFRLGVAYRARYDSPARRAGDVTAALEHWQGALALDPDQYIWRRRLQQFGPRLDKPYDFYFWVEQARRDILARGAVPVPLAVEPSGSEIAPPAKAGQSTAGAIPDPDPDGRTRRDPGFVAAEPSVTPVRVRPGSRIRVRVAFRLDPVRKAHWNNEGDPLTMSIRLPAGLSLVEGGFVHPVPPKAESEELRQLEFEAKVGEDVQAGPAEIPGYSIFEVCEDLGGTCRRVRLDFTARFVVDPAAVRLQ